MAKISIVKRDLAKEVESLIADMEKIFPEGKSKENDVQAKLIKKALMVLLEDYQKRLKNEHRIS